MTTPFTVGQKVTVINSDRVAIIIEIKEQKYLGKSFTMATVEYQNTISQAVPAVDGDIAISNALTATVDINNLRLA